MKSELSYICKRKEKMYIQEGYGKHSLKTKKLGLQHKKKKKRFKKIFWKKKKPDSFLVEIGFWTSYKSQDQARWFLKESKLSLDFRVS